MLDPIYCLEMVHDSDLQRCCNASRRLTLAQALASQAGLMLGLVVSKQWILVLVLFESFAFLCVNAMSASDTGDHARGTADRVAWGYWLIMHSQAATMGCATYISIVSGYVFFAVAIGAGPWQRAALRKPLP